MWSLFRSRAFGVFIVGFFLALLFYSIPRLVGAQGITRGSVAGVAVEDYDGDCAANDLNGAHGPISWWVNEMGDNLFSTNLIYPSINHLWVTDYWRVSWGRDHLKMDTYDAVVIGVHGSRYYDEDDDNKRKYRIFLGNTNPEGDCRVKCNDQMRIGDDSDGELEFLHLQSCHSMTTDDDVHKNTWRTIFAGVHQIHGFHGVTWGDNTLIDEFQLLAENGQSSSVASQWLNLFYEEEFEAGFDNCPVVYTGRLSSLGTTFILQNETYRNRETFADVSAPTSWKRWYFQGCDPDQAFPQS